MFGFVNQIQYLKKKQEKYGRKLLILVLNLVIIGLNIYVSVFSSRREIYFN